MASYRTRLRQGLTALFLSRPPLEFPAQWSDHVPEEVRTMWTHLSPYDQHHLVAVASDLEAAGCDALTVLAGLLHDIGKAGSVVLPARVAAVFLGQLGGVVERMEGMTKPPVGLKGLHLLLTHAERGACLLEVHGAHPRVVWLVRHHEDKHPDPMIEVLQAADNRH